MTQYLAETDRMNGFTPGTSAAIGLKESGLNPDLVSSVNSNGTRDYGMFQINGATLASLTPTFRKLYGRDPKWSDPHDNAVLQRMVLSGTGGSARHRVGAYNAGPTNADGAVGQAYADDVLGNKLSLVLGAGMYAAGVPSGQGSSGSGKQSIEFQHTITLQNQNGAPIAPPVTVSKQVGVPQATGSR